MKTSFPSLIYQLNSEHKGNKSDTASHVCMHVCIYIYEYIIGILCIYIFKYVVLLLQHNIKMSFSIIIM